jgi:hypothetical protein
MDRVYIHGLIQKILNKEFSNTHKRKINDFVENAHLREVMFI